MDEGKLCESLVCLGILAWAVSFNASTAVLQANIADLSCKQLSGATVTSTDNQRILGVIHNGTVFEDMSGQSAMSLYQHTSAYGNTISPFSANNSAAESPPILTKNGATLGYLTTNTDFSPAVSLTALTSECYHASQPSLRYGVSSRNNQLLRSSANLVASQDTQSLDGLTLQGNYSVRFPGHLDSPDYATGISPSHVQVNQDGSLILIDYNKETPAQWSVADDQLTLVVDTPQPQYFTVSVQDMVDEAIFDPVSIVLPEDQWGETFLDVSQVLTESRYTLNTIENGLHWTVTDTMDFSLTNVDQQVAVFGAELSESFPKAMDSFDVIWQSVDDADAGFEASELAKAWVLPVDYLTSTWGDTFIAPAIAHFETDNTGSLDNGQTFTWSINDGVMLVTFTNYSVSLYKMASDEGIAEVYGVLEDNEGNLRARLSTSMVVNTALQGDEFEFTFWQNSFSLTDPSAYDENGQLLAERFFGYQMNNGGMATRIFNRDFNIANQGDGWDQWYWQANDGLITLSARQMTDGSGNHIACELSDNCIEFRKRYWQVLETVDSRLYVMEWSERYMDTGEGFEWATWIRPRVQYYEALDSDFDGDGLLDKDDPDIDNDGVENALDEYPYDATKGEADTDSDGVVNSQDTDDDSDGIPDIDDAFPLNPLYYLDTDADGIADLIDTDKDNDGVANSDDIQPIDPTIGTAADASAVDISGRFGWPKLSHQPFMTVALGQSYRSFVFNADGSGATINHQDEESFDWTQSQSGIDFEFESTPRNDYFSLQDLLDMGALTLADLAGIAVGDFQTYYVAVEQVTLDETWYLIEANDPTRWLSKSQRQFTFTNESDRQTLFGSSEEKIITFTNPGNEIQLVNVDEYNGHWANVTLSGQWVLPVELDLGDTKTLKAAQVTLDEDGSGMLYNGSPLSWFVSGNDLTVLFADYQVKVAVVSENDGILETYATATHTDGQQRSIYSVSMEIDPLVQWQDLQNVFLQNGFSLSNPDSFDVDGNLLPASYFGFRLESSGDISRIYSDVVDPSELYAGWDRWHWQYDLGFIQLKAHRNLETGERYITCPELNDTCVVWRHRYWLPVKAC